MIFQKNFFSCALTCLLHSFFISLVMHITCAQANDVVVGKLAPPITLHTIDGQKIASRDLIGKVVIVTFWASYCEPCQAELPLLSAYAEQHAKQGLVVLGFSLDSLGDIDNVKKVAKNLYFPVGLLPNQYADGYGRIWRMPVSFVINRARILVDDGWKDEQPIWTKERLHRLVDPLLSKP